MSDTLKINLASFAFIALMGAALFLAV